MPSWYEEYNRNAQALERDMQDAAPLLNCRVLRLSDYHCNDPWLETHGGTEFEIRAHICLEVGHKIAARCVTQSWTIGKPTLTAMLVGNLAHQIAQVLSNSKEPA